MSEIEHEQATPLRREINLPRLVLYGVGTMLGAGVYALIGEVAGAAGASAPLSFLAAAIIAGFTGASFAEFSSRYPKAAGEAVYVAAGFGAHRLAMLVGLLIVASGVVSSGVMLRGFVGYANEFIPLPMVWGLPVMTLLIGVLAGWGIGRSVMLIAAITLLETAALFLVIAIGFAAPPPSVTMAESAPTGAILGIFSGATLAFYAFIGFEDMVNIAEEVKEPRRVMPIAIFASIIITTIIYVAVAWVAVRAVAPEALAGARAPMTLIYESLTGGTGRWLNAVALLAILNGALVQIVMAARVLYGLARQDWLPSWIGLVDEGTGTPLIATALVAALVLITALLLPLDALARATAFFLLLVFTLVNVALIRLKSNREAPSGAFHLPIIVPWLGAISAGAFAVFSLAELLR